MIEIADEPIQYGHIVGFSSSEVMATFLEEIEKYGLECDDIDFDHSDYCEATCTSKQPLSPEQMANIVLSGSVCHVVLNSVIELEEEDKRVENYRAMMQLWDKFQATSPYVERFADGREPFETDDTSLPVGEQNHEEMWAVVSFSLKHLPITSSTLSCVLCTSSKQAECRRIARTLRNKECEKRVPEYVHYVRYFVDGVGQSW